MIPVATEEELMEKIDTSNGPANVAPTEEIEYDNA